MNQFPMPTPIAAQPVPVPTPIPTPAPVAAQPSIPAVDPASMNPEEMKKRTPAQIVADRIAIRQAFLASMGIDWNPSDDDVRKEHDDLPPGGETVHLDRMVPKVEPRQEPKSYLSDVGEFNPDTIKLDEEDDEQASPSYKPKKNETGQVIPHTEVTGTW